MIESPLAVVLALLIFVAVVLLGWLVWRFIVEPRLSADEPRHMIETTTRPEPAPQDVHRPAWQSIPIAQLEPNDGEPPAISRATEVVRPEYLLQDALRRRH